MCFVCFRSEVCVCSGWSLLNVCQCEIVVYWWLLSVLDAGYASRLLTADMRVLRINEESLDVSCTQSVVLSLSDFD